jgi:hypothetical protein
MKSRGAVVLGMLCLTAAILIARASVQIDQDSPLVFMDATNSGSTIVDQPPVSSGYSSDDWKSGITAVMQSDGPAAALAYYDELSRTNPLLEAGCHNAYRYAGELAAATYGLVSHQTSKCENGFSHGLLRELGKNYAAAQAYVDDTQGYCVELSGDDMIGCYHGIGHGAALADRSDIQSAVQACSTTPTEVTLQLCSMAVFMEFGDDLLGRSVWARGEFAPGHSSDSLSDTDQRWAVSIAEGSLRGLCDGMPRPTIGTCYFNLWKFVAAASEEPVRGDEDRRWSKEYCSVVGNETDREQCYTGFATLGIAVLGKTGRITTDIWPPTTPEEADQLAETLVDNCREYNEFWPCLNGVVPPASSHLYDIGWPEEHIPNFCKFTIGSVEAEACDRAVTNSRRN